MPRPEREGVNASERELPVMTASELEEAFDIPVAELENRLNTVLTTDMVRRLKAAGMWNSSGLQEVAIRPGIVLNMISSWDPKKGLFLNTALIISEEEEAMIGVLTDINPEEGTTVPTMVVDYRVVGPQDGKGGGKTRLVLTCLKKDVLTNQGRISLPTVEEGGLSLIHIFPGSSIFALEVSDENGVAGSLSFSRWKQHETIYRTGKGFLYPDYRYPFISTEGSWDMSEMPGEVSVFAQPGITGSDIASFYRLHTSVHTVLANVIDIPLGDRVRTHTWGY